MLVRYLWNVFVTSNAGVVELVDTTDLKSVGPQGCTGSSPVPCTLLSRLYEKKRS